MCGYVDMFVFRCMYGWDEWHKGIHNRYIQISIYSCIETCVDAFAFGCLKGWTSWGWKCSSRRPGLGVRANPRTPIYICIYTCIYIRVLPARSKTWRGHSSRNGQKFIIVLRSEYVCVCYICIYIYVSMYLYTLYIHKWVCYQLVAELGGGFFSSSAPAETDILYFFLQKFEF